jgi:hypothetical protein
LEGIARKMSKVISNAILMTPMPSSFMLTINCGKTMKGIAKTTARMQRLMKKSFIRFMFYSSSITDGILLERKFAFSRRLFLSLISLIRKQRKTTYLGFALLLPGAIMFI